MNTAEGNAGSTSHIVIVHDDMPMRRAQLTAFLDAWAASEQVALIASAMPGANAEPRLDPLCRMVILSIGSLTFDRSPALHRVLSMAAQDQQIPAVVLAEAGSARDAATAFRAGAKGYIPASIEPHVALRALSFILHGGHFFPPTALQATRPGGRGGNDDTGRMGISIRGVTYRARGGETTIRRPGPA